MTTTYIDPRYLLQTQPDVDATKSGHIVLFVLVPNASGLPVFRGRWDDRACAVDVDLEGSFRKSFVFRRGFGGYSGHHTKRVTESPRQYAINIQISGARIFQGNITLGRKIGVKLKAALNVQAGITFSVTVVRPGLLRRFARRLREYF